MTIGDRIKLMRKSQNHMTLQELADRVGVAKTTMQKYESGEIQAIPIQKLELIAKATGCSVGYLLGYESRKGKTPLDLPGAVMLTDTESSLILVYRNMSEDAQKAVSVILNSILDIPSFRKKTQNSFQNV